MCLSSIYLKAKQLTVDHVVPKSKGGANDLSNYVLACQSCNMTKANRTPSEWIADIKAAFQSETDAPDSLTQG